MRSVNCDNSTSSTTDENTANGNLRKKHCLNEGKENCEPGGKRKLAKRAKQCYAFWASSASTTSSASSTRRLRAGRIPPCNFGTEHDRRIRARRLRRWRTRCVVSEEHRDKYPPISPRLPLFTGEPRGILHTKVGGYYERILGPRYPQGLYVCRLGSIDTPPSTYITYIHA